MEYILSFALLIFNLIDYQVGINNYNFLAISTAIFVGLFFVCYNKSKSFLASCLMMFCHTWQISWINIFGEPTSNLQLPWFYIVGVLVCIYMVFHFGKIFRNQISAGFMLTFVFLAVMSVFPLLTAVSKSEGIGEFIMIGFFLVMVFVAFLFSGSLDREKREYVVNAYIFAITACCIMILFQAVSFYIFGRAFFKMAFSNYMGSRLVSCQLLMEDTSCATIMLGTAVFLLLEKIEKKKNVALCVVLILLEVSALALTSRRTSVISLIAVLAVYAMLHYKGFFKKTGVIILFGALVTVMIAYLLIARPVDDLSLYLYDNLRFANYVRCVELSIKYPFGVGYGDSYLASLMTDNIIPHNTILRWLVMGGFGFVVPMVGIIVYIMNTACKKKLSPELWILLYAGLASNFIPDILNARFLVIPCMCALLFADITKKPLMRPQVIRNGR